MESVVMGAVMANLVCVPLGLSLVVGSKNNVEAASERIDRAVTRTGTVTAVDLDRHAHGVDTDVAFAPQISFEYDDDGTTFENDDYYPPENHEYGDRGWAESIVDGYEPGDRVDVYVDPEAPDQGFLEPERMTEGKRGAVGFGVAVLLVPVVLDAWLLFG